MLIGVSASIGVQGVEHAAPGVVARGPGHGEQRRRNQPAGRRLCHRDRLAALAALRDIRRRPSDEIRGPKLLWVLVSFVNFVGPLSYFKFGRVASKEREPATV